MLHHLHRCRSGLPLLLASLVLSASAEESPDTAASSWEAFLKDTDSTTRLLEDPIVEEIPPEKDTHSLLLIGSLSVGLGNSSNYLKRPVPVENGFIQIQGDAYLSWFLKNSVITGLFFAELNLYDQEEEEGATDEYLGLAQVNWTFSHDFLDFGLKLESMFAEQIYDASLSLNGAPESGRIQQTIPEAALFIEKNIGSKDRLQLELAGARAIFDLEGEDYWEPSLSTEWEHLWAPSLTSHTYLKYSRQFYDDDVGRLPNGNALTDAEPLAVDRFKANIRIDWKPADWKWLQTRLTLGTSWDRDQSGEYENRQRSWISFGPKLSNRWGHIRITGRWAESRFDTRYSEYYDPTPNLQTQRSLRVELKKTLPWDLELLIRGNWTRFDARSDNDAYSENRAEVILGYIY